MRVRGGVSDAIFRGMSERVAQILELVRDLSEKEREELVEELLATERVSEVTQHAIDIAVFEWVVRKVATASRSRSKRSSSCSVCGAFMKLARPYRESPTVQ